MTLAKRPPGNMVLMLAAVLALILIIGLSYAAHRKAVELRQYQEDQHWRRYVTARDLEQSIDQLALIFRDATIENDPSLLREAAAQRERIVALLATVEAAGDPWSTHAATIRGNLLTYFDLANSTASFLIDERLLSPEELTRIREMLDRHEELQQGIGELLPQAEEEIFTGIEQYLAYQRRTSWLIIGIGAVMIIVFLIFGARAAARP